MQRSGKHGENRNIHPHTQNIPRSKCSSVLKEKGREYRYSDEHLVLFCDSLVNNVLQQLATRVELERWVCTADNTRTLAAHILSKTDCLM